MKVYSVGGCVRDKLLGYIPHDYDYVVVGATMEEMCAADYTRVGNSFPVFLHPETRDEYALARKEVSTGDGYNDFTCQFAKDVTLEEDLYRRDLTINAIAQDSDGNYIDPYGGIEDLNNHTLRATSDHFKEDPLRVLRLCRFHAKFGKEWSIDRKTWNTCRTMVDDGMLNSLIPERVWREFEKALEGDFSLFLKDLAELWFLETFSKELYLQQFYCDREDHHPEENIFMHTCMCIDSVNTFESFGELQKVMKFMMMCHDIAKVSCIQKYGTTQGHDQYGVELIEGLCKQWKIPNKYRDPAVKMCQYHIRIHSLFSLSSGKILKLIKSLGKDSNKVVECCLYDKLGRDGVKPLDLKYEQGKFIKMCKAALDSLDTKSISAKLLEQGKDGRVIGETIMQEQIKCIKSIKNLDRFKNKFTTKR